mmetsp:Transcript_43067/g.103807  ORF Transcript_43067/g.103807 Transcript_43067/m.103807 type:complete len:225 (+) Transcript_43067:265-939(+)
MSVGSLCMLHKVEEADISSSLVPLNFKAIVAPDLVQRGLCLLENVNQVFPVLLIPPCPVIESHYHVRFVRNPVLLFRCKLPIPCSTHAHGHKLPHDFDHSIFFCLVSVRPDRGPLSAPQLHILMAHQCLKFFNKCSEIFLNHLGLRLVPILVYVRLRPGLLNVPFFVLDFDSARLLLLLFVPTFSCFGAASKALLPNDVTFAIGLLQEIKLREFLAHASNIRQA